MRMGRRMAWLGIIAIALFFSLQTTACSVVGLVVGYAVDHGQPKVRVILPHQAVLVSRGARVTLLLEDGTSVSGWYLGVGRLPEGEYARRYNAWRDTVFGGESFPALGDSITLATRSGEARAATFRGFGYREVMIGSTAGERSEVSLERLTSLSTGRDRSILAERLTSLDVAGELPSQTVLRVVDRRDTSLTSLDRVARVEVKTARHAARNGFLAGLALDVMVVGIATAAVASQSPSCAGPGLYGAGVTPLEAPFDTWTGRLLPMTERAAMPAPESGAPGGL